MKTQSLIIKKEKLKKCSRCYTVPIILRVVPSTKDGLCFVAYCTKCNRQTWPCVDEDFVINHWNKHFT